MACRTTSPTSSAVLTDGHRRVQVAVVTTETAGGYLAPFEYVREIIKAETLMSPVRSLVRVRQTAAKSIQIPKRTGQFAAQGRRAGDPSETTGLTYGLEELPT
jgi:HK97 family phage major capsid protein